MTRALLALLLIAGCKRKHDADELVASYRDRVCACKDMACVATVNEEFEARLRERSHPTADGRLVAEASQCIEKLAAAARPRDAAVVTIDAPPPRMPEVPSPVTADALLAAARAWQQELHPGLSPSEIYAIYIEANGTLDPEHGTFIVEYRFLADLTDDPKRKTGAPLKPSAERPAQCPKLRFQRGEWKREPVYSGCSDVMVVPKCTVEHIWKRGLAAGAPAEALASISYVARIDAWRFAITDKPRGIDIDKYFSDDCKPVLEKP